MSFTRASCEWSGPETPPATCFGQREPGYRVRFVRAIGDRILIHDPQTNGPAYVDRDALGLDRLPTPAPTQSVGKLQVPAPARTPDAVMSQLDAVTRVVQLVNDARRSSGLAPLGVSGELTKAAQAYSDTMAQTGCYAHDCPPVPALKDRFEQAGYRGWSALGENIYLSPETPEKAVGGWLASPEHRRNILTGQFTDTGVGLARDARSQPYWTQEFGSQR